MSYIFQGDQIVILSQFPGNSLINRINFEKAFTELSQILLGMSCI